MPYLHVRTITLICVLRLLHGESLEEVSQKLQVEAHRWRRGEMTSWTPASLAMCRTQPPPDAVPKPWRRTLPQCPVPADTGVRGRPQAGATRLSPEHLIAVGVNPDQVAQAVVSC